jgi:hypothetical protein
MCLVSRTIRSLSSRKIDETVCSTYLCDRTYVRLSHGGVSSPTGSSLVVRVRTALVRLRTTYSSSLYRRESRSYNAYGRGLTVDDKPLSNLNQTKHSSLSPSSLLGDGKKGQAQEGVLCRGPSNHTRDKLETPKSRIRQSNYLDYCRHFRKF